MLQRPSGSAACSLLSPCRRGDPVSAADGAPPRPPFKCPLHGQMIRSPDVQCIYFFRAGPAYGETGGFLADENFQRLSTLFRQLLGVVQSFDWLIWVKYDSRSTYWPGPGTTPGFIYSANDEMFLHPAIMA